VTERLDSRIDALALAVAIFGRGRDAEEILFRIRAYDALLNTGEEFGDDIDEFDVVQALEDLPGFRPRDEMRRIANELGLLERHGDGLLRLKRELYIDDFAPGDQPSQNKPIPVQFLRQLLEEQSPSSLKAKTSPAEVLEGALRSLPLVLDAAHESPIPWVAPFYQLNDDPVSLKYTGANPATTPFLSLFLAASEAAKQVGSEAANIAKDTVRKNGGKFIKQYIDNVRTDVSGSASLTLVDDDDFPGATLPITLSNGSLLSVTATMLRESSEVKSEEKKTLLTSLSQFLLEMQNDDGGWPVHRFQEAMAGTRFADTPSIPLFSLVAFAGLLDAFDLLDEGRQDRIKRAADRYAKWLLTTCLTNGNESCWANTDGQPCPYESAINASGAMICQVLSCDCADQLDVAIHQFLRFIDRTWVVGPDARSNTHKIVLRPPTESGSALVTISWYNAGHARLVSTLCRLALRTGKVLGFRTICQIQKAVELICQDCKDGFWPHISNEDAINISTTVQYLESLVAYQSATEAWKGHRHD
jgi:hypothetical protein